MRAPLSLTLNDVLLSLTLNPRLHTPLYCLYFSSHWHLSLSKEPGDARCLPLVRCNPKGVHVLESAICQLGATPLLLPSFTSAYDIHEGLFQCPTLIN